MSVFVDAARNVCRTYVEYIRPEEAVAAIRRLGLCVRNDLRRLQPFAGFKYELIVRPKNCLSKTVIFDLGFRLFDLGF